MLTFIRNQNFEQDAVYNIEACSYATKRNYSLRRRNFTFVGKKIEIWKKKRHAFERVIQVEKFILLGRVNIC